MPLPSPLDVLLGKVGSNSHPLHPAFVHHPITFLMTASALDIFSYIGLRNPSILAPLAAILPTPTGPNTTSTTALIGTLSTLSYISTIAAIITSLPALNTGIAELYAMMSARGGIAASLKKMDHKIQTTLIHAGLNDIAIAGAVYNWFTRRNREGFMSDGTNVTISAVLLGGVVYSAYLGGSLVYEMGTGVRRMGSAGRDRVQEEQKTKEEGKKEALGGTAALDKKEL